MYTDHDGMNAEEIMAELILIRSQWNDADQFPIRFQGGQGPVLRVVVERDDDWRRNEIVFHTGRG